MTNRQTSHAQAPDLNIMSRVRPIAISAISRMNDDFFHELEEATGLTFELELRATMQAIVAGAFGIVEHHTRRDARNKQIRALVQSIDKVLGALNSDLANQINIEAAFHGYDVRGVAVRALSDVRGMLSKQRDAEPKQRARAQRRRSNIEYDLLIDGLTGAFVSAGGKVEVVHSSPYLNFIGRVWKMLPSTCRPTSVAQMVRRTRDRLKAAEVITVRRQSAGRAGRAKSRTSGGSIR